MSAYEQLEEHARELYRLREVAAITSWDEACMMPAGSGAGRGRAMATLSRVIHDRATDPRIGELLNTARAGTDLDPWQAANLDAMQKSYVESVAIPGDLVERFTLASIETEQTWRTARAQNDWQAVQPKLATLVDLAREHADALAEALTLERYDALLETYEPELRVSDIDPIFAELKAFLPKLLDEILGVQTEPLPLPGPFAVDNQRRLCEQVMGVLGFDFDRGRLDVSHHPFCGGVPDDTRITTRYDEASFVEAFMATCHETGHALYQQGLPADWREQPVGDSLGAAVHESQSLLMELQVCRSRSFLGYAGPLMRGAFGSDDNDPAWADDNLYRHATRVQRGFIRVQADEVTYPLHVILRYELERQMLDGSLAVRDLPDAWDAAMQAYLGLSTAGNYADGCMQDVHWFAGLFGYFPTYTLGALAAAQWFAAATEQNPEIEAGVSRGEFAPLLEWLRTHVHGQGRRRSMQPLLEEVTGSSLDVRWFRRHLERRYLNRNAEAP